MSERSGALDSATPGVSLLAEAMRRLRRDARAMGGAALLCAIAALAAAAPWISPYDYDLQQLSLGATPPSAAHWLGTDTLGRDLLTRLLHGARLSLAVGAVATVVALVIGVSYGVVSGYVGGVVDSVMMRAVDILYSLPFMIFIILITVVFGRSLLLLFIAIGSVEWLTMARIVRGQVRSVRDLDFVDAARAMGIPHWRVMWRHVLPNVVGPIAVYATLTAPSVMLLEAFLSFLGLGVQPPQSSWGLLIAYGVESMEEHAWLLLFPGISLAVTLLSLNFLGDGLRDALDPKASR